MGRAVRARRPPEIHAADVPHAPTPRDPAPGVSSPGEGVARLALLSAAVRYSPEPVVVTDALDRVVAASEGLLRSLGREQSDVQGEPFASLIAREEGAPPAATRAREAERGGWQGDLVFRGAGAARAPVRATARAVRSPAGDLLGYVTLGQESGQRDSDRRKDRFLALIGHELRTPLASVQGFARLLVEEPDMAPDQRAGCLAVLDAEASRLRELLEDLLRAARLQSGEWRLAPRPLDPYAAVRDVVERAGPLARAQGRSVLLGPLPAGVRVLADPDLWPLTLRNVLQNAIRYGPEGGTVTVAGAVQDGEAVVTVSDDGPGIDGDEMPRVFDRFFRGRASAGIPGTGLGLSIARDVAWRHRGDLVLRRGSVGGTVAEARWPLLHSSPPR